MRNPGELPPQRRRRLTMPSRDFVESEQLAAIDADDVGHARQTARDVCTPLYNRYLGATLDDTERTP